MPPNRFESEVESFLEGSHGDRTHIKRADHHTVTPLCGTLLRLAERAGITRARCYKIFAGDATCTITDFWTMCDALNVRCSAVAAEAERRTPSSLASTAVASQELS